MANQITISTVSGTPTYDIYVCDITNTYCYLVSGGTTIPPAYSFIVPPPLDNVESLLIKIVDSNGCEKFILVQCDLVYKIFEDGDAFIFEDGTEYIFEG